MILAWVGFSTTESSLPRIVPLIKVNNAIVDTKPTREAKHGGTHLYYHHSGRLRQEDHKFKLSQGKFRVSETLSQN